MSAPTHPACRRSCALVRRQLPVVPVPLPPAWLDGWLEADPFFTAGDLFLQDVILADRSPADREECTRAFYRRHGHDRTVHMLRHAMTVKRLPHELAIILTRLESVEAVKAA